MDSLDVHNEVLSEKYLGMPMDVGSSTNGAFKYLKDRVWKRVQGWMEQTLSAGGKEVLIKAVAQAGQRSLCLVSGCRAVYVSTLMGYSEPSGGAARRAKGGHAG
jgi:hypothetical protein